MMVLLLALILQAQTADVPQQPQPDQPSVSLERIRRELERPQAIPANAYALPFFRIEIQQEAPSLERLWMEERQAIQVPQVPQQPLAQREFFEQVVPEEFRTGTVNPIGTDVLPYLGRAFDSIRHGFRDRSEAQTRKNIQQELEMLREARRAAGLPDR
jgi:hypothetical protein